MKKLLLLVAAVLATVLYTLNASWLVADSPGVKLQIISHRGVHQTFHREGLDAETCTAERIYPLEHSFLENTIPSMAAAFDAGADVVELDVHPTTDGRFAVFHDWTLDCRTNGSGRTRDHSLEHLKSLDIGYGYTADGGVTYPLRGKGLAMLPSLSDVFERFPEKKFLINFKSRDAGEADQLAKLIGEKPAYRERIWSVYGGAPPTERANELIKDIGGFTKPAIKSCLLRYLALGWSGYVPGACRKTHLLLPGNYTWMVWGWPKRFQARMAAHGTTVILSGSTSGTGGIDSAQALADVPKGFAGFLWTNRIETIGPLLKSVP